jgi:hypothetical protein
MPVLDDVRRALAPLRVYSHVQTALAMLDQIEAAPVVDQPAPKPGTGRPVWDLVIEDMQERDRVGQERYGRPLEAGNGRDALVDAYQEALDLAVYLRQAIEERA